MTAIYRFIRRNSVLRPIVLLLIKAYEHAENYLTTFLAKIDADELTIKDVIKFMAICGIIAQVLLWCGLRGLEYGVMISLALLGLIVFVRELSGSTKE